MKKLLLFISILFGALLAFSACSKRDTYADKLKKERRAIDRLIDKNDIDVLNVFPEDSIFAANEYYKDANTGVYFRVIDWGKGDVIKAGTEAFLRLQAKGILLVGNDTLPLINDRFDTWIDLTYGIESTYHGVQTSFYGVWDKSDFEYLFLSPACALPLKYNLRSGGIVSLIIPFSSGSKLQQSQYEPLYIPEMKYTFNND